MRGREEIIWGLFFSPLRIVSSHYYFASHHFFDCCPSLGLFIYCRREHELTMLKFRFCRKAVIHRHKFIYTCTLQIIQWNLWGLWKVKTVYAILFLYVFYVFDLFCLFFFDFCLFVCFCFVLGFFCRKKYQNFEGGILSRQY